MILIASIVSSLLTLYLILGIAQQFDESKNENATGFAYVVIFTIVFYNLYNYYF